MPVRGRAADPVRSGIGRHAGEFIGLEIYFSPTGTVESRATKNASPAGSDVTALSEFLVSERAPPLSTYTKRVLEIVSRWPSPPEIFVPLVYRLLSLAPP